MLLGGAKSGTETNIYFHADSLMKIGDIPYKFSYGNAIYTDNKSDENYYIHEVHLLGSSVSGNYTKHYKLKIIFDRSNYSFQTECTEVSTLPYNFYKGSAVLFNNEIHILGGDYSSTTRKNHYKWNGTSWEKVSTLPIDFYNGDALIYDNKIHIFRGTSCYSWDGISWEDRGYLPYSFSQGKVIETCGSIHLLGGATSGTYKNHYKTVGITEYDGQYYYRNEFNWQKCDSLPYDFAQGGALVYSTENLIENPYGIDIFGGILDSTYSTKTINIPIKENYAKLYLQKGNKIICDKFSVYPMSDNLEWTDYGLLCTDTGQCKFYVHDNIDNFLYTII